MVSSLNIKLSGEQVRSVIRAIDLDGGGFIDFPEFEAAVKRHEDVRTKYAQGRVCVDPTRASGVCTQHVVMSVAGTRESIFTEELRTAHHCQRSKYESTTTPTTQKYKRQVCGQAGSGWKMYVSPVHAIMIFHNVETNEEIWDYKATDKDLVRVVKDNIVGVGGIEAKKAAAIEREKEWQELLRNRCVVVLPGLCRCCCCYPRREMTTFRSLLSTAQQLNRTTLRQKINVNERKRLSVTCVSRVSHTDCGLPPYMSTDLRSPGCLSRPLLPVLPPRRLRSRGNFLWQTRLSLCSFVSTKTSMQTCRDFVLSRSYSPRSGLNLTFSMA